MSPQGHHREVGFCVDYCEERDFLFILLGERMNDASPKIHIGHPLWTIPCGIGKINMKSKLIIKI